MDTRFWIFTIVLLSYLMLRGSANKESAKRKLVIIACGLLALESGLRHVCVGPDTFGYYGFFQKDASTPWQLVLAGLLVDGSDFRDPGYSILSKAFSTIIPSWQLYLVALAGLFFLSLGRLWNRYIASLEGVLFATTLFIALFHIIVLSGMRQQITMSLSMLLIPYLEERKWKIVLPTIAVGFLIHASFVFYLAFIPFYVLKKDRFKLFLTIAILLIPFVAVSARSIVAFMASQMSNDYYMGYAQSTAEGNPYTYIALCTSISIFFLFNYQMFKTAPVFMKAAAVMMTLAVPLIVLDGSMIRIGQYFTIYMMLSLPYIVDYTYSKNMYLGMIVILCFLTYIQPQTYHFFWETLSGYDFEPFGI